MNTYILDNNHNAVPEPDLAKWGEWMSKADRYVRKSIEGDVTISTIFLGIDYSDSTEGPPLLFETMVFGGPLSEEFERCSTWEVAEKMHELMIDKVKNK